MEACRAVGHQGIVPTVQGIGQRRPGGNGVAGVPAAEADRQVLPLIRKGLFDGRHPVHVTDLEHAEALESVRGVVGQRLEDARPQ